MSENEPLGKSPQEIEQAATVSQPAAEADQFIEFIFRRTQELQAAGMPKGRASGTAMLEERITHWPPEWGNELRIIIYGDFRPPKADLCFPDLRIIVEAGAVKSDIVRSAICVVKARVTVSQRNIAGLVDACARINMLLGIWTAIDWGNAGKGWWCLLTYGSMFSASHAFDQDAIERTIKALQNLQSDVRRKVTSALHWIREPRQMMMEGYRRDVLQVFAGYWNAFECLIEAVCILRPQAKLGKREKQEKINQLFGGSRWQT